MIRLWSSVSMIALAGPARRRRVGRRRSAGTGAAVEAGDVQLLPRRRPGEWSAAADGPGGRVGIRSPIADTWLVFTQRLRAGQVDRDEAPLDRDVVAAAVKSPESLATVRRSAGWCVVGEAPWHRGIRCWVETTSFPPRSRSRRAASSVSCEGVEGEVVEADACSASGAAARRDWGAKRSAGTISRPASRQTGAHAPAARTTQRTVSLDDFPLTPSPRNDDAARRLRSGRKAGRSTQAANSPATEPRLRHHQPADRRTVRQAPATSPAAATTSAIQRTFGPDQPDRPQPLGEDQPSVGNRTPNHRRDRPVHQQRLTLSWVDGVAATDVTASTAAPVTCTSPRQRRRLARARQGDHASRWTTADHRLAVRRPPSTSTRSRRPQQRRTKGRHPLRASWSRTWCPCSCSPERGPAVTEAYWQDAEDDARVITFRRRSPPTAGVFRPTDRPTDGRRSRHPFTTASSRESPTRVARLRQLRQHAGRPVPQIKKHGDLERVDLNGEARRTDTR